MHSFVAIISHLDYQQSFRLKVECSLRSDKFFKLASQNAFSAGFIPMNVLPTSSNPSFSNHFIFYSCHKTPSQLTLGGFAQQLPLSSPENSIIIIITLAGTCFQV